MFYYGSHVILDYSIGVHLSGFMRVIHVITHCWKDDHSAFSVGSSFGLVGLFHLVWLKQSNADIKFN